MTIEEVRALTDDDLRVKIAELCGWEDIAVTPWLDEQPYGREPGETSRATEMVPNYCRDLNAMALAEKALGNPTVPTAARWMQYLARLETVCGDLPTAFATARQRAEAFALTLSANA